MLSQNFLLAGPLFFLAPALPIYSSIEPASLEVIISSGSASSDLSKLRVQAEQGDAAAQYMLGELYYHGEGVAENKAEAAKWYRLAAEQGDVD